MKNFKKIKKVIRRTFKKREFVPYQCAVCGLEPFWNGKPLTLTLDHINGTNRDNRLENLRWICPNCDRQSDTYGTRNKKTLTKGVSLFAGDYQGMPKIKRETKIITRPDRECLKNKLWEFKNYTQVANYYNVSTTKIRVWCREYNLPASINIIKHTSESGWKTENWNDFYQPKNPPQQSIPCFMIDKLTNEIIQEFPSRAAAIRYLNIQSPSAEAHIGAVCKGKRKTAYGYKWKDKNAVN